MRYLASHILEDLKNKMVFISGPRQVGKTSLSESLLSKLASDQYYSWDRREHREVVRKGTWDRSKKLVVFDELHKFRGWKSWLKGIYDTEKRHGPALLVTGSAKLNVFRHGGDSLLGRYHHYRLHPFSLKEWKATTGGDVQTGLKMLLERSGFPEPLFSKKMTDIDRWRKERLELVLRDDVISLENIRNLSGLESLMDLLSQRAGGCLSYQSLAEDLSVSGPTVKSWVELLERMYMVYRVPPYYRSLQRATRKEPKIYLYDYSEVVSPGTRPSYVGIF
jgi:predicted AAA+ superfamily ATPase